MSLSAGMFSAEFVSVMSAVRVITVGPTALLTAVRSADSFPTFIGSVADVNGEMLVKVEDMDEESNTNIHSKEISEKSVPLL